MLPRQCKAARGLLEIGQEELSTLSGIAVSTIVGFENGRRRPYPATIKVLRATLEQQGITFIDGDEIGVMMKAPRPKPTRSKARA